MLEHRIAVVTVVIGGLQGIGLAIVNCLDRREHCDGNSCRLLRLKVRTGRHDMRRST